MWVNLVVKTIILFHFTGPSVSAVSEEDGDITTNPKVVLVADGGRRPVVKAKELDWETLDVAVPPRRVFKMSFNANMFSWSEGNLGGLERHEYKYTPALRDSAGLPEWMKYRYSRRHKAGFLYGVPPTPDQLFEIDVVAVNRVTFEYGLLRLAINVTDDDEPARHAVKLKIDNLDVADMFDAHRMRNLKALFSHNLWNGSRDDLYLAYIASAVDLGFRRPLDPALKDGLVVFLASDSNFSQSLLDLDQETAVLRGFPSCPRDFKRTSVERHFRAKGFALDWCEFRLLRLSDRSRVYLEIGDGDQEEEEEDDDDETQIIGHANQSTTTPGSPVEFPRKNELPLADLTFLYIQTIVPTLAILMLLFLLLSLIFCLRCPCALEDDESLMVAESNSGSGESDKWDGLTASFYLVLKDCVTCCNSVNGHRDKATRTVFLRNREHSEPHQLNRISSCGDPRYQRASSVQRQTDTLRRLAQQRDVAQRLQTPAPSLMRPERPNDGCDGAGGGAMIITNPMAAGYATPFAGNGGGGGGPVLLISDEGGVSPSGENGDLAMGGASRGRRRPVPPPYASPADAAVLRANVRAEVDGTYLV